MRMLVLLFVLLTFRAQAQLPALPVVVDSLPAVLNECSSLEVTNDSVFWAMNDHGDGAKVYRFDHGQLRRTVRLKAIKAIDCESMARDEQTGALFIGDFGNNKNNRRDLTIWKIADPAGNDQKAVLAEAIRFHYPDQHSFPPGAGNMNFDGEALLHFNHHLYIFSKDRSGERYTKCYRLPDSTGTYTAELLDSLRLDAWVTGADISPDGKTVALLSEMHVWLFTQFDGDHFFGGRRVHYTFDSYTQKEAIAFGNNGTLYLADERTGDSTHAAGGKLYRLDIAPALAALKLRGPRRLQLSPGKAPLHYDYDYRNDAGIGGTLLVTTPDAETVLTLPLKPDDTSCLASGTLDLHTLPSGRYIVQVVDQNGQRIADIIDLP